MWTRIAESFRAAAVEVVEGPNATDLRENLYTASLLARDDSFDLVYLDVTWTAKFAAAGWLLPLDGAFAAHEQAAFLSKALEAGRYQGALYRLPMRTDIGLLYYRRDLSGRGRPGSAGDVRRSRPHRARAPVAARALGLRLAGEPVRGARLQLPRSPPGPWRLLGRPRHAPCRPGGRGRSRRPRTILRTLGGQAISPPGVTAYKEDESRRLFQDGRAVFLRNWSYVWRLVQAEGRRSPARWACGRWSARPGRAGGRWGAGVWACRGSAGTPTWRCGSSGTRPRCSGQRALCSDGYAPALRAAYDDPGCPPRTRSWRSSSGCTSARSAAESRATRSRPTSCSAASARPWRDSQGRRGHARGGPRDAPALRP